MKTRLATTAILFLAISGCASGGDKQPDASLDELCAPCDPAALCEVSSGQASCVCPRGYTDPAGDGSTCRDIDECITNNHDCDDRATCTNTQGGYTCTCNDGYQGDGTVCRDINECLMDGLCGENATCINQDGGYMCRCNDGYSGDGIECTDIDECDAGSHDCHANATCANVDGGYTCTCNIGYNGDGHECLDIDECLLGIDDCDGITVCRNLPGSYTCACPDGYHDEYGDGTSCKLRVAGRLYLIGHDYFTNTPESNLLIGNAVFSTSATGTLSILAYNQYADNAAGQEVSNVNAAINARAAELGRNIILTTFDDYTQLPAMLPGNDVLLVYEQEYAPPNTMRTVGQAWSFTVETFLRNGGTVVVTDFGGSTWQILNAGDLMHISATNTVGASVPLTVTEPSHPISHGVELTYPAPTGSRYYMSSNGFTLVQDPHRRGVVLVRTFIKDCVTVEDFEAGTWPSPYWTAPSGSSLGVVQTSAAHDHDYGITSPSWHYQTALTVSSVGDRVRTWVRLKNTVFAKASIGLGSSWKGTYSVELRASSRDIVLQRNDAYAFEDLQKAPYNLQANKWYQVEVQYGGGGLITMRLYEDGNPSPLFTLSASIPGLTAGGTAIRGHSGVDIDTVEVCPAP